MMAPERPGPEDEPDVAAMRGAVFILQDKEGDSASVEMAALNEDTADKPAGEDNDLTSLSWLHDKNLLKEMNLKPGSQESPTSDFVDDSASELAESTCSSGPPPPSPPPAPRQKHPQHMPYDPQVHTTSKPPYSFSCLIFMAIEDSLQRALPVKDIYTWVLDHFPYFKTAPTGWKNSVRHNLSLNKCFRKVDKAPNLGKGSLWMVDPTYRPNLLQALQKAPFHPYTTLDRINMVTSRHSAPGNGSTTTSSTGRGGQGRLPDPDLFPFLARRLAASGVPQPATRARNESESSDNADMDDVHAANAIMQLKHGPRIHAARRDSWLSRRKPRSSRPLPALTVGPTTTGISGPVMTTSPSEDHTYSAAGSIIALGNHIGNHAGNHLGNHIGNHLGNHSQSPDEAFGEGSDSDSSLRRRRTLYPSHSDSEEQRKIAEGADALLNLAGIATAKRPPYPCDYASLAPRRPPYPGEHSPTGHSTPAPSPRRPRKRPSSPPVAPPSAPPSFRPRILRASRPKRDARRKRNETETRRKRKPINNNSNINNNNNNNNNASVANGNKARAGAERDWTREERRGKARR